MTRIRSGRRSQEHALWRGGEGSLTAGGLGSVGEKAAAAIADFIVLDMFANYCTGREDAKGAIAIAERQPKRHLPIDLSVVIAVVSARDPLWL